MASTKNKKHYTPQKQKELTCGICGELKKESYFFVSYHSIHSATGRLPYCKKCLDDMIRDENNCISIDNLKKTLKLIDRPYLYDLWELSLEENPSSPLGVYMKNLALKQNRDLKWRDSIFEDGHTDDTNINNNLNIENFRITDDIMERWGYGFQPEEYLNFERKYKKLTKGYKEKTALHSERLDTYIIHKVKEEMATARGDVNEAEKWAKLAQKDAQDAKLNVSQLSKSDITGGIDLLPQLVEAVEQYTSLIPLLPKVLEQPYDDADLIIWANINYLRHLEDKPFVPYRDIWNFYDRMLEEHFKQKGFTDDQIKEEKRKRNNVFRDLGNVYIEPLYENPDDFIEDGEDLDVII